MAFSDTIGQYTVDKVELCYKNDAIDKELFQKHGCNMGLRDINGKGVLTGLTNISEIDAFKEVDGVKVPCDGELYYRGYNVKDLVNGNINNKYIFV